MVMAGKTDWPRKLFLAATLLSVLLTGAIFCFLLYFGLPLLKNGTALELMSQPWRPERGLYGIASMIRSSLILTGLSMAISLPMSLGASCVITTLAPPLLRRLFLRLVRFMTSIPTVVYSFAALFLLVPLMRRLVHGSGLSLLTAAPVLALLIAPTMIIFFVSSFTRVPRPTILAADALGASPAQKLLHVILPQSLPGILTGTLLGFGRAMGDTMVSLMLAGNAPAPPQAITDPGRTLTAHIALVMAADFGSMQFKTIFVCGLILYLSTACIMLGLRFINRLVGINA